MEGLYINSILISAYIGLNFCSPNFYKLHRYEGKFLYLRALTLGAIFLSIAYVLCIFFPVVKCISDILPDLTTPHITKDEEEKIIFYSIPIIISILYCFLYWALRILYLWWKIPGPHSFEGLLRNDKLSVMYNIICDSPLDNLLFYSYLNQKFLILSMKDRKVYVGRVFTLAEPNENKPANQEISLVLLLSGYRDSNTLKVHLINDYGSSVTAAVLTIKQSEIITAAEFSKSLHDEITCPSNKTAQL